VQRGLNGLKNTGQSCPKTNGTSGVANKRIKERISVENVRSDQNWGEFGHFAELVAMSEPAHFALEQTLV
jgi:hypothetical protein